MSKTIFYDVTELVQYDKGTGIQRVTSAILNILKLSPPLDWKIVPVRGDIKDGNYYSVSFATKTFLTYDNTNTIISPQTGDIFLSVDLTYNITPSLRNKLTSYRKKGIGIFFVLYDLIPIEYPHWFEGTNNWFEGNSYLELFNYWFNTAVNESDGLICISESVQKHAALWLKQNKEQVKNNVNLDFFHLGCDFKENVSTIVLDKDLKNSIEKLQGSINYLMVGTIEPRKGYTLALYTLEKLWAKGENANLIIVGRPGWHMEDFILKIQSHPELNKRLFWFNGINDEYLMQIYNASSVLLALSEAEGFGLPLVEAGHYDLPIIARDIPIFREICKDGAFYLTANNTQELFVGIKSWQDKFKKDAYPKSKAIQPQSWKTATKQLFTAIEKIQEIKFRWND